MPLEINYRSVPSSYAAEGFRRYVEDRIPTGSFLRALLENDLRESFGRADHINIHLIRQYVTWMWNNLPANCWGSKEAVANWLGEQ